jgi:tetratricopeptide (TPR) repeat protein
MLIGFVSLLAGLLSQPALGAMSRVRRSEVFYQAQRAYEQATQLGRDDGDQAEKLLRDAANGYQALVDDGVVNGRLYYNLGNTCLRLNEIGKAILYYRKAQRYLAEDDRLSEGLRVARSVRRNDIPVAGRTALIHALLFWHYSSTLRARATVGIAAYVAFWLIAIAATFVPRAGWRYPLIVLAVVWVSLGVSVAVSAYGEQNWREGIVVADDVVVGKDPGLEPSPAFEEKLHQGVEFELLGEQSRWYHIELPDGKTGWIPKSAAALI